MQAGKRKRLEAAGWKVGSAQEFLGLTDHDSAYIDVKIALARALAARRAERKLTQVQVAKRLRSSQSRVAKMEAGDPSVSADLLIRSLLALGATPKELGKVMSTAGSGSQARRPGRDGRTA
jgi:hypothetical protein